LLQLERLWHGILDPLTFASGRIGQAVIHRKELKLLRRNSMTYTRLFQENKMADVTLDHYIKTSGGRFSFADHAGFICDEQINIKNLDWYKLFLENKAFEFFFGNEIFEINEHNLVDLLICCRQSLAENGALRFDISAHSNALGLENRLVNLLLSLGFAVQLHISPYFSETRGDLRPYKYGSLPNTDSNRILILAKKTGSQYAGINGSKEIVYAVGDSHIWFLSGQARHHAIKDRAYGGWRFENTATFFKGYHLGPGLAYNLGKTGTTVQTTERLEMLFDTPGYIPARARLILSFGEIDCRGHVCRIADERGLDIAEIVEGIVISYRQYLIILLGRGYRPMVWGPVAPTVAERIRNTTMPIYGRFDRRLAASRRLTERLESVCLELGIPFISILERLLDESGRPDQKYYEDPIHVGGGGRPLLWEVFQKKTGLRTMWSEEAPTGPGTRISTSV
jgi:hypothetical protein